MDLVRLLFDLLDTRSFATLWYWILLCWLWAASGARVLGLPWDLILAARQGRPGAEEDLTHCLRAELNRRAVEGDGEVMIQIAVCAALLTGLAILGFGHGYELALALFCLVAPRALAGVMAARLAMRLRRDLPIGMALYKILGRHRFGVQMLGLLAIVLAAVLGVLRQLPGFGL